MRLTARQLNRETLRRQLLSERASIGVVDAARQVVAIQAQEPASPYVALWNRIDAFDPADLDRAFEDRQIVKAPLMRITLHAVAADEYASTHEAMTPTLRAARLNDRRFRSTGRSAADADALIPGLVDFAASRRTRDEILEHLAARVAGDPDSVWWALRTYAPLLHAPTGPPWSFGLRPCFEAAPSVGERPAPEAALRALVVGYLEGFGPASVADFAQFSLRKRSDARAAFDELRSELVVVEGPGGEELFDVAHENAAVCSETPAPPRLLAMWDSILLAYADRSRVIPEDYRSLVIRRNGDVLPAVLVDGHVAGVWRPAEGGIERGVEITAFRSLAADTWAALALEVGALRTMLAGRDPEVYRRYARWWTELDVGERRVVG